MGLFEMMNTFKSDRLVFGIPLISEPIFELKIYIYNSNHQRDNSFQELSQYLYISSKFEKLQ